MNVTVGVVSKDSSRQKLLKCMISALMGRLHRSETGVCARERDDRSYPLYQIRSQNVLLSEKVTIGFKKMLFPLHLKRFWAFCTVFHQLSFTCSVPLTSTRTAKLVR